MDQYFNIQDKKSAKDYINKLCEEYIHKHTVSQELDELIVENNIEKRDIRGYHGREILELLQNADDAYQKSINHGNKPRCNLEVKIEYKQNVLTVSNTGTFFDADGIKAIVQGNNSPKKNDYIGNKGTGFRSILNWADEVKIFSGLFNIKFSKAIAEEKFAEVKEYPQIKKQIERQPNLYIPMLALPVNISGNGENDHTTIEITINPDKINDNFGVTEQIENIDLRCLLFLPNISVIEIVTDSSNITYRRSIQKNDFTSFTLEKIVDGEIEKQEQYYFFEKTIEKAIDDGYGKKDIRFAIAVPIDFSAFQPGYLYSFFPLLDTESPFSCVLHASYVLGDHRDTITRNDNNKQIIREQLRFLIEIANEFIDKGKGSIALPLLTPIGFKKENFKLHSAFSKFGLESEYLEFLKPVKMLTTVNDAQQSIENSPQMIHGDFPDAFIGDAFHKLLRPITNEQSLTLVNELSECSKHHLELEESELLQCVNDATENWSIPQQVDIFIWWNNKYKKSLPNLLKTQSGLWLKYQEECFFLVGDFANQGIPSWVRVPALDPEYQKVLFENTERLDIIQNIRRNDKDVHISRLICQNSIYSLVGFNYRDRSNIITTVNSSVDTYNKAIDFVKWIWANYRQQHDWTPPQGTEVAPIRYRFPSVEETTVQTGDKMYFGTVYENALADKLFDEEFVSFPAPSVFDISENDLPQFQEFIRKFGVNDFPPIKPIRISPLDAYDTAYEKKIWKTGDVGASSYLIIDYRLPYIRHLEDTLQELSMLDILQWICSDKSLYSYISSPYYIEQAEIKYIGTYQKDKRTFRGKIDNYILFVFNEIKWIEIEGVKYAPKQVLLEVGSRNNSKFDALVPILSTRILQEMSQKLNIDFDEILEIMKLFKLCEKVTDLSSEDFYGLLLRLPEYEYRKSVELSKTIYRLIEQATFTNEYEESENKDKFFQCGKILVQYEREIQYYAAKEAYLPSSRIISKYHVPIVEKGQRTNSENFIRVFGCQQYNKEYTIQKDSIVESKANQDFQQYFSEFLKYARAYSERNENLGRSIDRLSVVLVDKINIIENGQVVEITDEYVCVRKSVTSWYITTARHNFEINPMSVAIENICDNIANSPGFESSKIRELFRAKDRADREFLIKEEFGSLDVINDISYQNEIRNNFVSTLQKINSDYPIDTLTIDFDNFLNEKNLKEIKNILQDIKTDVDVFKGFGFVYTINLIPYYKNLLRNLLSANKKHFKNKLYKRAIENESYQSSFLSDVRTFERYEIEHYDNSIYFNVEGIVRDKFGDWGETTEIDADSEYAKNYDKMNLDRAFEDNISNDLNAQRMIYFNKKDEFEVWRAQQVELEKLQTAQYQDSYSEYNDVIPEKAEIEFNDFARSTHANRSKQGGVYTQSAAERKSRNQKIKGNIGELLIYNSLCKDFGKTNVTPRSEAFVELGILKPGQAISGEYDISYKDESGIEFYVEVKTGDGHSFIMSPGELNFAKEHPKEFKLFLVYDIDNNPQYRELPMKFWESNKFRKAEIVERIEFEF